MDGIRASDLVVKSRYSGIMVCAVFTTSGLASSSSCLPLSTWEHKEGWGGGRDCSESHGRVLCAFFFSLSISCRSEKQLR